MAPSKRGISDGRELELSLADIEKEDGEEYDYEAADDSSELSGIVNLYDYLFKWFCFLQNRNRFLLFCFLQNRGLVLLFFVI